MQPTEKLYFADSALLEFSATVLDVKPSEQGDLIVLDRTAFYPTGGGQPNDTGTLDDSRVVDVVEADTGVILHVTADAGRLAPGQLVRGCVDSDRRLDHMQQHSGQHVLSQAFVRACGGETRSFHLGSQTSTIDIELASPTDEHMRAAEELANRVVFEDRPLRVHIVNEDEATRLPLRKEAAVSGAIRVIEVEDFDWSPCGGTHASRTGQIGLIAIKSFERAKRMARVEFVCGRRALAEYRQANSTAVAVARLFSADRDATPELVERAINENKSLKKRIRELVEIAAVSEASRLLAEAPAAGGFKLVQAVFDDRELDELRVLASRIVEQDLAVALLGSGAGGAARLVFARSAGLHQNMGQLLAQACQIVGGRGGGRPELAQGGGPDVERLSEAIERAADTVLSGLRQ
jgi:alanyl-tRNA synthetase